MTNSQLTPKHTSQSHAASSLNMTTNTNKKSNKNNKQQQQKQQQQRKQKQKQFTLEDGNIVNATQVVNNKQHYNYKKKHCQQPTPIVNSTDKVVNTKFSQYHNNQHQQHQQHQRHQQHQQHRQHRQHQRHNVLPAKVQRTEGEKDSNSMTDTLQPSQADLLSSTSPISSSATDSEDSEPNRVNHYRSKENKKTKKNNNNNNKNNKKLSLENDSVFSPLVNLQQQSSKKSPAPYRQHRHQKNKIVYAGPTFNNAPAPSSLPIPSPTLNNNNDGYQDKNDLQEDVLYTEVISPRPMYHQPDFQQQSRDLMNLLAPSRFAPPPPPPPMMMMPTMMNYPPRDHALSQIQRDLRFILKLEVAS